MNMTRWSRRDTKRAGIRPSTQLAASAEHLDFIFAQAVPWNSHSLPATHWHNQALILEYVFALEERLARVDAAMALLSES